jgi:hypothetical protein
MGVKLGISHYWKKTDEDEFAVLLDAAQFFVWCQYVTFHKLFSPIKRIDDDTGERILRNVGTLLPDCTA